ncbi:hypothetical protein [Anaerorhabdus sp.]|uniref:hypothetical protein n=1 Tax=Anaerorhabdus sp. TaxID=1872524 RepID=UPI002FC8E48E
MKIIRGLLIGSLILIGGCSSKPVEVVENTKIEYVNAYEKIDKNDIYEIRSMEPSMNIDPNDAGDMYSASEYIAIARVISIDGGDSINEESGNFCKPHTYGKLEILNVYKGDLQEKEIGYVRSGGIITYQAYYDGLSEGSKRSAPKPDEYEYSYVKEYQEGDIEIEVGEIYLVYLTKTEIKSGHYLIIGWQGGLRKVRMDNVDSLQEVSNQQIEVYNNKKECWETLDQVLVVE